MGSSRVSRSSATSVLALGLAAGLAASLTGCYVVPIDPRTGQAYPGVPQAATPSSVTVINPAVALPAAPAVIQVRLYPLNMPANTGGLLNAVVVDDHAGRGRFTVAYLGDTLQGESTRVDAGYASFGRVHDIVLGPTYRASAFNGRRGIATAYGAKGVSVQCEYLITGPSSGTGVCAFSDGGKYQMHFGG